MTPTNGGSDLTPQKLEFGYWIATHRVEIRKAGTILLAILAAIMVLMFIIQLVIFLAGIPNARAVQEALITNPINYGARERPQPIVIQSAEAVMRDDSHIDVVVVATNTNTSWGALEYTYELLLGSFSAGTNTLVIAPGQTVYFAHTNIPFADGETPSVVVNEVSTSWLNRPTALLPVDEWEAANQALRSIRSVDQESSLQTELRFTLKNKSVYGFVAPTVTVLLKNADNETVAVGSVTLNQIDSLESRELTFRWPARLGTALQTEVYVAVDKLNEHNIITE